MNKAFYIIAIPAFVVSFCWLYYSWGLTVAVTVIVAELIGTLAGLIYLRRRAGARAAQASGR